MKKIRELFRNTKLNIKFTSIIILFMGDSNRGVSRGFVLCYGAECGAGEHGLHGIYNAAE